MFLSLDGRGNMWTEAGSREYVPNVEDVLKLCPNVQEITFQFGIKRVHVSSAALGDSVTYPNLKKITVVSFVTKRAFCYLWSRCPNLETFKATSLTVTDALSELGMPSPTVVFDTREVQRLLRSNRMTALKEINVSLTVKDSDAAKALIEGLPALRKLSTLRVRVGLPQEDYPGQEQMLLDLAAVMQAMRQFKLYVDEERRGQEINWKWERFGILESFAEIEQLNNLIEPNF